MGNRPSRVNTSFSGVANYGSIQAKNLDPFGAFKQAIEPQVGTFGDLDIKSVGQAIGAKGSNQQFSGQITNFAVGLEGIPSKLKSAGIPVPPPFRGQSYGKGYTNPPSNQEQQVAYIQNLMRLSTEADKIIEERFIRENEPLRQEAKQKLGVDLSLEQVAANRQLVQEALQKTPSFTPSQRNTKISFEALAEDYNKAVTEHTKIAEEIQKETNPVIFNARVQRELPDIENRIRTLGEDYNKLAQTVEKHQPKIVEVGDYGKYKNRFKGINVIRSRISETRAQLASETDPFKKEAHRIIDEPNLESLEAQLKREEKQYKRDIGTMSVSRGASGQTPQIVGGPTTPFLVGSIPQRRQKSNMLAGLPDLGDVGAMVTSRDMKRMERNMTRQPRRKSQIDKFLNFKFGGW